MSALIVVSHVFSWPPIFCVVKGGLCPTLPRNVSQLNGLSWFTPETEAANTISPLVHNLCALHAECD